MILDALGQFLSFFAYGLLVYLFVVAGLSFVQKRLVPPILDEYFRRKRKFLIELLSDGVDLSRNKLN